MRSDHSVLLGEWIDEHRKQLTAGGREPLVALAGEASGDLGFKVGPGNLSQIMKLKGMPTRRTGGQNAEKLVLLECNERLQAEVNNLTLILTQVVAKGYIPKQMQALIFKDLPGQIREAIGVRFDESALV